MSVYAGPETLNENLVFSFDMGNTFKSWKGAPTTNLASGNFFNGNANFTVNQNVTDIMPDGSIGIARELNAQTVVDPNRTVSIGSYSLTAGATYTLSFYVKNYTCTGFGGNLYSPTLGTSIPGGITYPTVNNNGIWVRVTSTFTVPTTSGTPVIVSPQVFRDAGFGLFRLCWLQLEQSSFATPYVASVRSNTQALLDLLNINTITINDLTYASNNTFSFDGVNDTLTSNTWSNMKGSSWNGHITLEGFLKINNPPTNSAMGYFGFNSPNAYFKFMNTGNLFLDAGSTVPSRIITNCIVGLSSYYGQWLHVCAVYDGTVKTYFNGVLQATSSAFTLADISSVALTIGDGMGYYNFQGSIDTVKAYNRALTAAEIQQNFNALRGRFGI